MRERLRVPANRAVIVLLLSLLLLWFFFSNARIAKLGFVVSRSPGTFRAAWRLFFSGEEKTKRGGRERQNYYRVHARKQRIVWDRSGRLITGRRDGGGVRTTPPYRRRTTGEPVKVKWSKGVEKTGRRNRSRLENVKRFVIE